MDERDDCASGIVLARRRGVRRSLSALAAGALVATTIAIGTGPAASSPGTPAEAAPHGELGGAPVAPIPVRVRQPDGGSFRAVPWGDARSNGLETLAGYTVVQDPAGVWRYADGRRADGELAPSTARPDRQPPPAGVEPGQRPAEDPAPRGPSFAPAPEGRSFAAPAPSEPSGTGDQPTLVILVEHDDIDPSTDPAEWHDTYFDLGSRSVRSFYRDASFGRLDLVPAADGHGASDGVVGWLPLAGSHPDTAGSTGSANVALTRAAISAAGPHVDFAAFDIDGDHRLQADELHIVVVVAGSERSYGAEPCGPSVWAHNSGLHDDGFELDGVVVAYDDYVQVGEMHCRAGSEADGHPATVGVLVHEMGHSLGLPDLYDTRNLDEGLGEWSVMAGGSWNLAPGDPYAGMSPALPDAWSKALMGWITPQLADDDTGTVALGEAATSPHALQLLDDPSGFDWRWDGTGSGETFLVENRQQVAWDAGLPACGLLVYHVDESQRSNRSGSTRRLVAVEQADGLDNLGDTGEAGNRGDDGDPFPGATGNARFGPDTHPSSDLYSGAPSGVDLAVDSTSCAPTMEVTFPAPPPPPPPQPPTQPPLVPGLDALMDQIEALNGQIEQAIADVSALIQQLLGALALPAP